MLRRRYRASHYARPGRLGTDRKQPVPGHPPRTHRNQRGHARGERRCTVLRVNGHRLFFYSRSDRDDPSNRMEIDFLIVEPYENAAMKYRVSPIEVKSSKRYRTVSLDKFKAKLDKKVGTRYVLHPKPLVVENDVVKLPIYIGGCLEGFMQTALLVRYQRMTPDASRICCPP